MGEWQRVPNVHVQNAICKGCRAETEKGRKSSRKVQTQPKWGEYDEWRSVLFSNVPPQQEDLKKKKILLIRIMFNLPKRKTWQSYTLRDSAGYIFRTWQPWDVNNGVLRGCLAARKKENWQWRLRFPRGTGASQPPSEDHGSSNICPTHCDLSLTSLSFPVQYYTSLDNASHAEFL